MTRPLVDRPIIIAHRGVPESHHEHTRSSYLAAIADGADFIEPDVVATADGHLIVRHENEIGHTTDVADRPEFADRRRRATIDGRELEGWFVEDFTLEEIKRLRTRERIGDIRPHNLELPAQEVLTFDEVLQIQAEENARRDAASAIGVYVETKHPSHFALHGLDLNRLVLEALERFGLNRAEAPVVIQSFETDNLRRLRTETAVPLVQLIDWSGGPADLVDQGRNYRDLLTGEGLDDIAAYARGIGPHKRHVIALDAEQNWNGPTDLVVRAHERGLWVHPWTMRSENAFLPRNLRRGDDAAAHGEALAEHLAYFEVGVDGLFSDVTATAVAARNQGTGQAPLAAGTTPPHTQ